MITRNSSPILSSTASCCKRYVVDQSFPNANQAVALESANFAVETNGLVLEENHGSIGRCQALTLLALTKVQGVYAKSNLEVSN
ncbi:unnamed protein product [Dovyalis caffra]|uniref:Uncharacterized protein n=1 Tax=Dovyalis caffra TaxID=77055 RepID=A0AAV1QXA7_9ROSI|nr:unnamed protein product [Dovyalis caffra]